MHLEHDPNAAAAPTATFDDFLRIDIRIGRIIEAEPFPEARKPAYRLRVDFGPTIGIRQSSAQVTARYGVDALRGRLVAAVVNFPPRRVGPFSSQVLTLGFLDAEGQVVLFSPDHEVPLGSRLC